MGAMQRWLSDGREVSLGRFSGSVGFYRLLVDTPTLDLIFAADDELGTVPSAAEGYVHFAVVSSPIPDHLYDESVLVQVPLTTTAFVVIRSALDGVANTTEVALDCLTLARIWAGSVVMWNNSAIAAHNPEVALPGQPITLIARDTPFSETLAMEAFAACRGWRTCADASR